MERKRKRSLKRSPSSSSSSSCSVNTSNKKSKFSRKKHTYFLRSMAQAETWTDAEFKKLLTALKTSWAAREVADWNLISKMMNKKTQRDCKEALERKKEQISLFGKLLRETGVVYDYKNNKSLKVPNGFWNATTEDKYPTFKNLEGIPYFSDWRLLLRVVQDEESFSPRQSKRSRTASGVSQDASSGSAQYRAVIAVKKLYKDLLEENALRAARHETPLLNILSMNDLLDLCTIFKKDDPLDANIFLASLEQDGHYLVMAWLRRLISDYSAQNQ